MRRIALQCGSTQPQFGDHQVGWDDFSTKFSFTRVAIILNYTRLLESMGAPVDRLLASSGISAWLLQYPAAAIPLKNTFRFLELACRTQGTDHLGLHLGLTTTLDEYGAYGAILKRSLTVHEYVQKGITLYNMLVTGQRFWLSAHGKVLRINVATVGEPSLGAHQAQMETLAVTIATLRAAAGYDWAPAEINLAYRSRENVQEIELFAGSRISRGTGYTYFTIPRTLMQRRFPGFGNRVRANTRESPADGPLPDDLRGVVQLQIETLLSDRRLQIDSVAESLAMNRRCLQRKLLEQGLTYSQMLAETRLRMAAVWLDHTDKPITEIAFDLGYTDASNFTRAFRRKTGVPPQTFRDNTQEA